MCIVHSFDKPERFDIRGDEDFIFVTLNFEAQNPAIGRIIKKNEKIKSVSAVLDLIILN